MGDTSDWTEEILSDKLKTNPDLGVGVNSKDIQKQPLNGKTDRVSAKGSIQHPHQDFINAILEVAELTGWLVHVERPAMTAKGYRTPIQGDAGFPDIVLTKRGKLIFWEVKIPPDKVRPEQQLWLDMLALVPRVIARVVEPDDWDYIIKTLSEVNK
uniref:Putative VRR-NUC domain-containing protein n=1 Tax=viral metagenome TaxID=1070528 RepID=A0A6M3KM53_9ZZZZ